MESRLTVFRKKWLLPSVIALASWIISQFLLWRLGVPFGVQAVYCLGYVFVLLAGSRTFGFVFIYRVMVPLLFGVIMVSLYRELYNDPQTTVFLSASRENFIYLQLLFDILATLYAICTAFLLWKGLTDHDTLRKLLSNEANNIERLLGYLHYFDNQSNIAIARHIRVKLKQYIYNIVDGDEIKMSQENTVIIRDCGHLVSKIEPDDDNDKIALAETMKALSDIASARSQRISQMEIRMSPYILMALSIMSCAVIFPFFTEAPSSDYVREVCIFTLSSILSFLLVTLLDISRPFNGFWAIKTDAFHLILDLIENELKTIGSPQLQGMPSKSSGVNSNEQQLPDVNRQAH